MSCPTSVIGSAIPADQNASRLMPTLTEPRLPLWDPERFTLYLIQEMEEATWERTDKSAKCYLCTRAHSFRSNHAIKTADQDLIT
eukprot:3972677-Amphidinium_carterae.1